MSIVERSNVKEFVSLSGNARRMSFPAAETMSAVAESGDKEMESIVAREKRDCFAVAKLKDLHGFILTLSSKMPMKERRFLGAFEYSVFLF